MEDRSISEMLDKLGKHVERIQVENHFNSESTRLFVNYLLILETFENNGEGFFDNSSLGLIESSLSKFFSLSEKIEILKGVFFQVQRNKINSSEEERSEQKRIMKGAIDSIQIKIRMKR